MTKYTVIARYTTEVATPEDAAKEFIRYADQNGLDEETLEVVDDSSGQSTTVDANQFPLEELFDDLQDESDVDDEEGEQPG